MKISDVVTKSLAEVRQMKPFDMNEMPRKAKWYLRPLAWLLAYPRDFQAPRKDQTSQHERHQAALCPFMQP